MNTSELKLDLIQAISSTDDLTLLQNLNDLLSFYKSKETNVYHFNEEQLLEINEALEQVKNGDYMSEEEAEKDIQQWFDDEEK